MSCICQPAELWRSDLFCYVLLCGVFKHECGFFFSQMAIVSNVLGSVGRGCKQQGGFSLVEAQVLEKYGLLYDGDLNGNAGFPV